MYLALRQPWVTMTSLDVFGIHGVAGIVGALGLAVLMSADLVALALMKAYTMMSQFMSSS